MKRRALAVMALLFAPATYLAIGSSGCGSSSPAATNPGPEGGADHTGPGDSSPQTDSPPGDTSPAETGPAGNMHFIALNGLLPVLSNVRYCFAASATGTPGLGDAVDMSPQPAAPGLAPGLLSKIEVPNAIVGQNVRVFVYYTTSLTMIDAGAGTCADLFKLSALSSSGDAGSGDAGKGEAGSGAVFFQTLDFDVSDVIPGSVFTADAPYLIYSTGCPLSSNPTEFGDSYYCGQTDGGAAGAPPTGDFHVFAMQLSNTAPAAGKSNVQGINGITDNNYFNYLGEGPYAVEIGVQYTAIVDGGAAPEGGAGLLTGPIDAGALGTAFNGLISTGPVPPPTALPALSGATGVYYIATNWTPPDSGAAPCVPCEGDFQNWTMASTLSLSGLATTDLSAGKSFTLIQLGDNTVPQNFADGGFNPTYFSFRLIRNDNL